MKTITFLRYVDANGYNMKATDEAGEQHVGNAPTAEGLNEPLGKFLTKVIADFGEPVAIEIRDDV